VPTEKEYAEIFPKPSVSEVACEIRFAPRLRVIPEIWRIQEELAESYPEVMEETITQADARLLQTFVFANSSVKKTIRVSQENFAFITNTYSSFEDFKSEGLARVFAFAEKFDVSSFKRVGLRYVNNIALEGNDQIGLLRRFVNVPIDLDRFDVSKIDQFLTEFRLKAGRGHRITIRGAFIQIPNAADARFILDLDCYSLELAPREKLASLLDEFHHEIQTQFLNHITNEYKEVMRRTK
jgi:uncharacterized protein (TIGR04255 family)